MGRENITGGYVDFSPYIRALCGGGGFFFGSKDTYSYGKRKSEYNVFFVYNIIFLFI